MRALLSVALFTASAGLFAAPDAPDKPDAKAPALDGSYTIVSGEEEGKAIPADRLKGSLVKFAGKTILGTDKDKKEFFSADFTLDTSKTPWVINMTSKQPKEMKTTGLIKKDGDTVTVIYALPGGEAPKEFKTKEKQQMFVLKTINVEPNKFLPPR